MRVAHSDRFFRNCRVLNGTGTDRLQVNGFLWQIHPAEVSRNSWIDIEVEVEQSLLNYLNDLDREPGPQAEFKKPPSSIVTKKVTTSATDPECGYIHNGRISLPRKQP